MISEDKRTKYIVLLLFAAGIFVRFYFYFGHVFSDDGYYDYLAYTLFKGNFGADYLGYPICLIRTGQSYITALSFSLFGTNEAAATVFPMLFSILNMVLNYKITKIITKSEITAVIVLLFTAFYPTEILFASIAFTDLFSTVFINFGILLLFIADMDKRYFYAVLSGLSFALSVTFKINVFYTAILLSALFLFLLIWKKSFNKYILISLAVLGAGMCLEGVIYYFINGDIFYRLTLMSEVSAFSKHDFFNEGSAFGFAGSNYLVNLSKLLFIENPSAVFLRRSMALIPLLAVLHLLVHRKLRKNRLVVYWFTGLSVLYMFFTMSLSSYQPIVIRFTWYLFPLFLPAMILASKLFSEMKKRWMLISLVAYIIFSLFMTAHFRRYFDMDNINKFKQFVKANCDKQIYADHFTKYSIDLIDRYKQPSRVVRLNYSGENSIPSGSFVVCHPGHISEIAKQGFSYPDENFYRSNSFEQVERFGPFIVFLKK
ncbi:MAG: glycosyltransferase family 39 protein [Candidatus Delongbacteria bacterium]|nr:glycosyltransferase family 39 protein [Candidatus Delongbacteria bacterium]MCG2760156.1 glycosyltransferase family 39 protein [Candidatus Delongbacteria bacterium]